MPVLAVSDGAEIFYSVHGSGPSVVLLHGWSCDGADWSWLASDLAVDHQVVIVDLRGHGRSTNAVDPYGAEVLAHDVAEVLQHLAIDHAVVVGHSMGGIVGSALAVEFSQRVSALIMVDPRYGALDERAAQTHANMEHDPLGTALAVFARGYVADSPAWQRFWHERRLHAMPPSAIATTFTAMWGPNTLGRRSAAEPYLVQRQCPILAVYAGVSAEAAEWERSLTHGPHDQVVVWDTAGHFLHQERPEEFALLVRDWLGGLTP